MRKGSVALTERRAYGKEENYGLHDSFWRSLINNNLESFNYQTYLVVRL